MADAHAAAPAHAPHASPASASPLLHHFADLEQQKEATRLGMWVFLVTEILFFGGLFATYVVYRMAYYPAFLAGSHHLSVRLGFFNTLVLIGSSLTMAMAVHAAALGRSRHIARYLGLTILLGTTFLGVKVVEYREKIAPCIGVGPHTGCLVPGARFDAHALHFEGEAGDAALGADAGQVPVLHGGSGAARGEATGALAAGIAGHGGQPTVGPVRGPAVSPEAGPVPAGVAGEVQIFYSLYFAMTGLHALHMIIGIPMLALLARAALRGRYTAAWHTPVELVGLYWHFVDIVWIFLFPLLYLVGHR